MIGKPATRIGIDGPQQGLQGVEHADDQDAGAQGLEQFGSETEPELFTRPGEPQGHQKQGCIAFQRKEIGNALSAHVTISTSGAYLELLDKYRAELPMWLITSEVSVERGGPEAPAISVRHAAGDKCPRCWRFVTNRVPDGDAAGLCTRCADAIGASRVGTA